VNRAAPVLLSNRVRQREPREPTTRRSTIVPGC
jgi:hypothetical protein